MLERDKVGQANPGQTGKHKKQESGTEHWKLKDKPAIKQGTSQSLYRPERGRDADERTFVRHYVVTPCSEPVCAATLLTRMRRSAAPPRKRTGTFRC